MAEQAAARHFADLDPAERASLCDLLDSYEHGERGARARLRQLLPTPHLKIPFVKLVDAAIAIGDAPEGEPTYNAALTTLLGPRRAESPSARVSGTRRTTRGMVMRLLSAIGLVAAACAIPVTAWVLVSAERGSADEPVAATPASVAPPPTLGSEPAETPVEKPEPKAEVAPVVEPEKVVEKPAAKPKKRKRRPKKAENKPAAREPEKAVAEKAVAEPASPDPKPAAAEPEKPVRFADVTVFGSDYGYGEIKIGADVWDLSKVGIDRRIRVGDHRVSVRKAAGLDWEYVGTIHVVTPGRYKLVMRSSGPQLTAG